MVLENGAIFYPQLTMVKRFRPKNIKPVGPKTVNVVRKNRKILNDRIFFIRKLII